MITPILLLLAGLIILLAAGESLVRGAASLARLLNIPALVVGLTVVAFGTSAPELVVTVRAVLGDASGIAMGNIVGSNIANILFVLGLPAIIAPISMTVPRLRRHGFALLLATALFCGLVYRSAAIGTSEAIVLFVGILAYFALMVGEARAGDSAMLAEAEEIVSDHPRLPQTLGLVAVGLIGLPIGAALLVDNGAYLARTLGVRDEVIGLTIVAFGTSLPELATVMAASIKRQASVAVGGIVGSNVFNMLFVGSAAGFVGDAPFAKPSLHIDLPVMMVATALIVFLIWTRMKMTRVLGVISVALYLLYIAFTGWTGAA